MPQDTIENRRAYQKAYQLENAERLAEQRRVAARRRYAENPEKYKAINKAKYEANPGLYQAASTRWKEANVEDQVQKRKQQYLRRKREEREVSALIGARNRAKQKGMEFDLTKEWVKARSEKCELSGLPFRPEYDGVHNRNPFAPSVDRIDSSKGYTQDNCRVILYCLNMGLGQWGLEEVAPIWAAVIEKLAKPSAPV
jgi:hypothetical protein